LMNCEKPAFADAGMFAASAIRLVQPCSSIRASASSDVFDAAADACNSVIEANSKEALERILMAQLEVGDTSSRPRYVFFDLDECIVMPATPFIDGLPGTDALMSKLSLCGDVVLSALRREMEEEYYRAPMMLVDAGLPSLISDCASAG